MLDVTATTFIRDSIKGAFCLFESMATWLALPIKECIVLDLGSTDGTLEILQRIELANPRVHVLESGFTHVDAKAFADAANHCVALSDTERVIFWQADEIVHETLLAEIGRKLEEGVEELTLWRYQLRENFQRIKWFPHPVHRIGLKSKFEFVGDGMNTQSYFGHDLVGPYNGGWFTRWGAEFEKEPTTLPTEWMVLDVSLVGAFLENIRDRRLMHAPFWHEPPTIEGTPAPQWMDRERRNPNWAARETPFDIPAIMRWHLGARRYIARGTLVDALIEDQCAEFLAQAAKGLS